jgi:hypothetical protein
MNNNNKWYAVETKDGYVVVECADSGEQAMSRHSASKCFDPAVSVREATQAEVDKFLAAASSLADDVETAEREGRTKTGMDTVL